mmetsp:Transcript_15585/g.40304  ORF Transcript_15585/g.40304 Transcript_15585/m.40304 type:complete len:105 (-) Transcript_15585:319-633(-)
MLQKDVLPNRGAGGIVAYMLLSHAGYKFARSRRAPIELAPGGCAWARVQTMPLPRPLPSTSDGKLQDPWTADFCARGSLERGRRATIAPLRWEARHLMQFNASP